MSKGVNTNRLSPEGDEFIVCYSHGALVIGRVYSIVASEYGPTTAAVPAAMAAPGILAGVCMETASASGEYVTMQTKGYTEAYVEATTDVAAGDSIKVLKSEYAFKQDTSGGAESVNTSGWAVDAQTDAGPTLSTVYLSGRRAVVAA